MAEMFKYQAGTSDGPVEWVWVERSLRAPLRPHQHAELQITHCLQGIVVFDVADMMVTLTAGDAIVVPPDIPHRCLGSRSTKFTYRNDYIATPADENIDDDRGHGQYIVAPSSDLVTFDAVLEHLRNHGVSPIGPLRSSYGANRTLLFRRGLDILLSGSPVRAAANQCGMSVDGFISGFRRVFGLSPYAYAKNIRLNHSRAALRRGHGPATVAASTGFSDQSHLTRDFVSHFGITPARFRRIHARSDTGRPMM